MKPTRLSTIEDLKGLEDELDAVDVEPIQAVTLQDLGISFCGVPPMELSLATLQPEEEVDKMKKCSTSFCWPPAYSYTIIALCFMVCFVTKYYIRVMNVGSTLGYGGYTLCPLLLLPPLCVNE